MSSAAIFLTLLTAFLATQLGSEGLPTTRPSRTPPTRASNATTPTTSAPTNRTVGARNRNHIIKRKPCPMRKDKILPPLKMYAVTKIFSEHQFVIEIDAKGQVGGTTNVRSKYARMRIETAGLNGLIRIKGLITNLYLSMNYQGKLYSTLTPSEENVFRKKNAPKGVWVTYESFKYCNWYIGFKRNQKPKLGYRVYPSRHNSHFTELP